MYPTTNNFGSDEGDHFPNCCSICGEDSSGLMIDVGAEGIAHEICVHQVPPCTYCGKIFHYTKIGKDIFESLPCVRNEDDEPVHEMCHLESDSSSDEEGIEYEKFLAESNQTEYTEVHYNVTEQYDRIRTSLEKDQVIERNEDIEVPLPPSFVFALRQHLQEKMKDFVFRRVGKVVAKEENKERTVYSFPCGKMEIHSIEGYPSDEIEKRIVKEYSRFFAFTTENTLRDNDPHKGKSVYLSSGGITEPSITDLTFTLQNEWGKKKIPPQTGDLVCMIFDKEDSAKKSKNPRAKLWWICSEQFLRFWTLVMFDDHPSFEGKGKEPRMEERLMSGNRLNTNSYLKYMQACSSQNILHDFDEVRERFRVMRTEEASKNWCHVYSALILMVRYGRLPTYKNIPNNRGGNDPACKLWSLPCGFISNVFTVIFAKNPVLRDDHIGLVETLRINDETNVPHFCREEVSENFLVLELHCEKKKTIELRDEDFPVL